MIHRPNRTLLRSVCLVTVTMAMLAPGTAYGVMWSNHEGANLRFGWNGGQNEVGIFGDPTVTLDGFAFQAIDPQLFRVEVGVQNAAGDMTQVRVVSGDAMPASGDPIESIVMREHGTWWAEDPADLASSASFNIFRWDNFEITPNLVIPIVYHPDYTWTAQYTFTTGAGSPGGAGFMDPMTDFRISVSNSLNVLGDAPAGTYMDKHGLEVSIPEPSTLLLVLGIGSMLMMRRRRP